MQTHLEKKRNTLNVNCKALCTTNHEMHTYSVRGENEENESHEERESSFF